MQLDYKALITSEVTSKKRTHKVKAANTYEAHKLALKYVNLNYEEIDKIVDIDGTLVFSLEKGFIQPY
jgi:hypothetical protein